ncbi:MAG: ATP-binding protein [Caldilineaceae bacterium]|nr:ATP-binding protein [Caldilineaceae bacterium]
MLVEFATKNFRSIKERQTLSMVSTSSKELRDSNTMPILSNKQSLVRSAVIYGPNAAGKSNLIKALKTMEEIVLESAQGQRGDKLPVIPYSFDPATATMPTEFNIVIVCDNVRYDYGFAATPERVVEEWLLAYPKGRAQSWIDRKYNPTTECYEWGNTEKLIGPRHLWQEATRSNALFLSTAIQLNNKQLQPIFDWFNSTIRFLDSNVSPSLSVRLADSVEGKNDLIPFIQNADFAISDIEVQHEKFNPESIPGDFPNALREQLVERLKDAETVNIQTVHRGPNGDVYSLDMDEESEGTKAFFAFAGPWLDVLKNGWVLAVDELDSSLHPLLVKHLVQMFHNPQINKNGAQLIFTTHETSILSQEVFRRDQIWFVEKDEFNATSLYPLSDFSPRKGVENLESGYLRGRYGALPYFRNIERLMAVDNG